MHGNIELVFSILSILIQIELNFEHTYVLLSSFGFHLSTYMLGN